MPGGTFPLGWTRKYGEGNVFVLLLGHDARSFQTPAFQQLVLNGVDWAHCDLDAPSLSQRERAGGEGLGSLAHPLKPLTLTLSREREQNEQDGQPTPG